jgi:hypothetical protein
MTAIGGAATNSQKKQSPAPFPQSNQFIGEPFDRIYIDSLGDFRNF